MLHHPQFVRHGHDIEVEVPVAYSTLALGGTHEIPTPEGNKKTKLKAGLQSGVKVRLKGLGFPAGAGGARGDVYAKLEAKVPEEGTVSDELREALERLRVLGY
jgi:curved DNA-binding protein